MGARAKVVSIAVRVPALVLLLVAFGDGTPHATSADPRVFLQNSGGFSSGDLAALDRGEPVARALDTDRREVAIIGAVRINATVDRILAHYRDVSLLGRSAVVEQVGTFGAAPLPADLAALRFEDYDLETIRGCTPGDCGVRLSAADMARFRSEVNWNRSDWRAAASASWRKMLAEFAAGYLTHGTSALPEYHNKEAPLKVREEMDILFAQAEFFKLAAPEFVRHVHDFPRGRPGSTEQVLYWTKDNFGVRPVFSITHLLTHRPAHDGAPFRPLAMIAAKQIYATHYFDAGLALTAVYAHPSGGVYLVSMNRARTRSLVGVMRTLVRSTVRSRSREAMEKVLRSTKGMLEGTHQPASRAR